MIEPMFLWDREKSAAVKRRRKSSTTTGTSARSRTYDQKWLFHLELRI